jgi:hypothetical protein
METGGCRSQSGLAVMAASRLVTCRTWQSPHRQGVVGNTRDRIPWDRVRVLFVEHLQMLDVHKATAEAVGGSVMS